MTYFVASLILPYYIVPKNYTHSFALFCGYRQISSLSRTKSQHLNDSRAVLRLSLPNPLKPDVKSRMKM